MTEEYYEQHEMDIIRGDDVPEPYIEEELIELEEIYSGKTDSQG